MFVEQRVHAQVAPRRQRIMLRPQVPQDGNGVRDYPAGTFIHHPAGTSHVPQSETGCKLFVFFPEG